MDSQPGFFTILDAADFNAGSVCRFHGVSSVAIDFISAGGSESQAKGRSSLQAFP
jgi:hypothetical protein